MATILSLMCGVAGFLAGLGALALGASPLAALAVWSGSGLLGTLLALACVFRARRSLALVNA